MVQTMKSSRRTLCSLLSLAIVSFLGYMIGQPLTGGFPRGNDTPYHLTWVFYLDRYFPSIPQWFYAQGSGFPFLANYPPLSTYVLLIVHRVSGLTILNAASLIGVIFVVAIAIGVYLFVRIRFEDEFMATMSALLVLLTPAIWSTLGLIGSYAFIFSIPFSVFVIVFLELKLRTGHRKYFLLATISYTFSIISHLYGGLMLGTLMLFCYVIVKAAPREMALRDVAVNLLGILFAGFSLAAFWYIPFFYASPQKSFGGYVSTAEFWSVSHVLGFPHVIGFPHLSAAVNFFVLIGAVLSWRRRGLQLWLLGVAGFFVVLSLAPSIASTLGFRLGFPFEFLYGAWPFILPAAILLPVVAGFGLAEIQRILVAAAEGRVAQGSVGRRTLLRIVVSVAIVGLLVFPVFYVLDPFSPNPYSENAHQLSHEGTYLKVNEIQQHLRWSNLTRIDISPRFAPMIESVGISTDVSMVSTYFIQGPLNHEWWAYQQGVFYAPGSSQAELATLARWWGIEYVVLEEGSDPLWKYENSFEESYRTDFGGRTIIVLKSLNSTGLVTVKNVPSLLVIGSEKGAAFQYFFLNTIQIGYDCEDFYPIQGGEYIDDYSLEDLKTFDTVFLHGYKYHDSNLAWKLLRDYVSEGGSLIINTGWQYESADWSNPALPEPSPVKETFWTDYGKEWRLIGADHPITKGINFSNFSPPIWGTYPWGLSSTNNESLRQWAQPILWNHGHPLVVIGRYGEGKVVWQGIDLRAHSSSFSNLEEYRFIRRIIDWTMQTTPSKDSYDISRPTPDKMVVDVREASEDTAILFREGYHPNWHSYVEKDGLKTDLKIYKAGPGFIFVRMPNVSPPFRVTFQYEKSLLEWGSIAISFISLVSLVAYTTIGPKRKGEITPPESSRESSCIPLECRHKGKQPSHT